MKKKQNSLFPYFIKPIINSINKILFGLKQKNSFTRNWATTMSGSIINLLIQLTLTPFLTRIYSPEVYGIYAVFTVVLSNLTVLSNLSYFESLILSRPGKRFLYAAKLNVFLAIVGILLFGIFLLLGGQKLLNIFFGINIGNWIWFIIPILILNILNQILATWNILENKFNKNVSSSIIGRLASKLGSISYGKLLFPYVSGLIFGDIIFSLIQLFFLRPLTSLNIIFKVLTDKNNKKYVLATAKYFKNYPKMVFPARWLNLLSSQIPIWIFGKFYSSGILGNYSFAVTMINIPIKIIGNSLKPVFYKKAIDLQNENPADLKKFVIKIYFLLLFVGGYIVSFLTIFGDIIFKYVFGEDWGISGQFAGILGFSYLFILISTPLSSLRRIYKKEKQIFYVNIILFLLRTSLFGFIIFDNAILHVIIYFAFIDTIFYVFNTYEILKIVLKRKAKMIIFYSIVILSFFLVINYGIKELAFNS